MKIFFVSASLMAIGAASVQADTYAPDVTAMDASKIWSLSGTLRGFYDDNYTTAHSDATGKRGSWGFEFSPSLSLLVPLQQTELGLQYTYGLYYYQDRENNGSNPIDQSHQAHLWIDHAFTERWEGKVQDTFTSSQEPQLSASGNSLPYRVEGNNINNLGMVSVHTEWSMLFSTDLSYQNNFVSYQNHGGTAADPSLAGYLDQIDHTIFFNLNYQYRPDLQFLIGYQFGLNNYTAGEPIGVIRHLGVSTGQDFYSSNLDSYSHYVYLGGTYAATESLTATVQAGIQYTANDNLPSADSQSQTSVSPYANIAVTYTYLPGDYVQIGFTESQNSSDAPDPSSNGSLTTYEQSSVLYGSINHQVTPFLLASLTGRWQSSTYNGGADNGGDQVQYSLGLNLSYEISQHLSAELGYDFDYVTAAVGLPSYTRNREYIGITANY
ncbi:MAG TPA: outer membrane beta-barrel protein [Candidatus Saccharimonadales bacterium]|nr:outer membrane beta-barrel protein [Candidatus Saccharimonadales bacterium]